MANLYTKTGDKGQTSLFGGSRISKDNLKVHCYGTIDEAISMIGLSKSYSNNKLVISYLNSIQQKLFILGAEIASDSDGISMLKERIKDYDIVELENIVNECSKINGVQKNFVVPGKNQVSASIHVSRTIVRRAERLLISLKEQEDIPINILKYINRLSDALYAIARLEETNFIIDEIKDKVLEKIEILDKYKETLFLNLGEELDLDFAIKLSKLIIERAKQINVNIVFSVVDNASNLILLNRMPDSLLASIDLSINKAYTSNSLKMATHKLAQLSRPGDVLYGITHTNPRLVAFGGGYPIFKDNKIIGAIGVSGGSVEEDMDIALYAINKINNN